MALRLHTESFTVATSGRGLLEITQRVAAAAARGGCRAGLVTVFLHHTSASLVLSENADLSVQRDVEAWFARAVPDGDPLFTHTLEGADDMPAHLRTLLTHNGLLLPLREGCLDLGPWQGVFLYEHRRRGRRRRVTVTVLGR